MARRDRPLRLHMKEVFSLPTNLPHLKTQHCAAASTRTISVAAQLDKARTSSCQGRLCRGASVRRDLIPLRCCATSASPSTSAYAAPLLSARFICVLKLPPPQLALSRNGGQASRNCSA